MLRFWRPVGKQISSIKFLREVKPLSTMAVPFDIPTYFLNSTSKETIVAEKKYVDLRNERDAKLENLVEQGIKYREEKNIKKALPLFNQVLFMFKDEQVRNLTDIQKLLLAQTYTCLADILRAGSREDEAKAVSYLDLAIDLASYEPARKLREDLLQENHISYSSR